MAAPSAQLFKLTIKIDKSMLPYLHEKKIRLCSAFGATTNLTDEVYNVIATSDEPAHQVLLQWTDVHQLAACNHALQNGDKAVPNTTPLDVLPGTALALDATWTDPVSAPSSPHAPDGFTLLARVSAVAILVQHVRENFVPVYVTSTGPHLPPPHSRQIVRPNGTVVVFLMRGVAASIFDLREAVSEGCIVRYADELMSSGDNVSEGVVEFGKDGWMTPFREDGTS